MFDLIIHGGTIVTNSTFGVADIGIKDGKIIQIGGLLENGSRQINAAGNYVFPGGVDVHVHLSPASEMNIWVDDFWSGGNAAIVGGITTVGIMTFPKKNESLLEALKRENTIAERDAAVDYFLTPVLADPSERNLSEIPKLRTEGYTSLKVFLLFENFDLNSDRYLQAMELAGQNGILTMVHCEDGRMLKFLGRRLIMQGKSAFRYWPESSPEYIERSATERAIAMARLTNAPIYVVHLSSASALKSCMQARFSGQRVYVETRPIYLYLTSEVFERPDGPKYVGQPPLRGAFDVSSLWNGLVSGEIQCVCSDHAPWTLQQKLDPSINIDNARSGVAELETLMPMLFSEGVLKNRISLGRFVELTSTNAAKLFGIYPRKGTIAIGSDADLTIWDKNISRIINGKLMQSRAEYSVYDGKEVTGWPIYTISRGHVVYEKGSISSARGHGKQIFRDATIPL